MPLPASLLVAFDGSPDARGALVWGAELAQAAERPLRVVIARGDLYSLSTWADEWTAGLADEWAAEAGKVLAEHGFHPAEVQVLDGRASEALVRVSSEAGLLVLGSRGHGTVSGLLLGSVSQHVTRHAVCPVVVTRPAADPESDLVVVGVDGSDTSLGAFELALELAALRGWRVHAIHCREYPSDGPIDEAVSHVAAGHPVVTLTTEETTTHPARALVDASLGARLTVVGSRGRGAFAGLLLGSVSAEVTRSAKSPVVIGR